MTETLKEQCATKKLKVGHFIVEFATPGIGHIVKNAGCDFALFDLEHSGFSFETAKSAVRYFEAAGCPTIVRVPSKAYDHIARGLDIGAEGIMLPMVNDAEEARHILDCVKYVPAGKRGVALGIAHDGYSQPTNVLRGLKAANARTTLFAQIETKAGVENAEAIASLDGVDCLWVGHFDLSCSLGIPGKFDHPDFVAAIETVVKACKKTKTALGRLVPTVEQGGALYKEGFDFICYSGDVWLLGAALKAGVDDIRAAAKPARRRTRKTA
ncbi:MAG: aldolase/citrate lyase family protein [Devosia sp.]